MLERNTFSFSFGHKPLGLSGLSLAPLLLCCLVVSSRVHRNNVVWAQLASLLLVRKCLGECSQVLLECTLEELFEGAFKVVPVEIEVVLFVACNWVGHGDGPRRSV